MGKWIQAAVVSAALAAPGWVFAAGTPPREGRTGMTTLEQRELDQMQRSIADLQRQLAEKQAELDRLQGRRGVGGAGQPASVFAQGTVQGLSPTELNLRGDDGVVRSYPIDRRARALRKGKRIPIAAIREGSQVRASLELVPGRPDVYWIDVLREPQGRAVRRGRR